MRLRREHRAEEEEWEVEVEERRAERVLFCAGGQESEGARDNSAKKERKLLPSTEEGLGACKSLPSEKEGGQGSGLCSATCCCLSEGA